MKAATIIMVLSVGVAEADSSVNFHAAYLSAPTEWCAADQGVPVIFTMSGLEVHTAGAAPFDQAPRVTVRRGGQPTERIKIAPVGLTEMRSRRGVEVTTIDTTSFQAIEPRTGDAMPLGKLTTRTKMCQTLWSSERGTTVWHVESAEGDPILSGEGASLFSPSYGVLGVGGSYPRAFKIGDQVFVVMQEPEFVRTTEAFASPAEEQDK